MKVKGTYVLLSGYYLYFSFHLTSLYLLINLDMSVYLFSCDLSCFVKINVWTNYIYDPKTSGSLLLK